MRRQGATRETQGQWGSRARKTLRHFGARTIEKDLSPRGGQRRMWRAEDETVPPIIGDFDLEFEFEFEGLSRRNFP